MENNEEDSVSIFFSFKDENGMPLSTVYALYILSLWWPHKLMPGLHSQMVPLIKKCTDNLVTVIEGKAASQETFDVLKYVLVSIISAIHNITCLVL